MDPIDSTQRYLGGTQVGVVANVSQLAMHRLSFVASEGPDAGRRWEIVAPAVSVGTAPGNAIELGDDTVSRHHCEIVVREDRFLLRDLGSTNGTALDGVWIVEAWLEPGSRVRVGQTELVFECDRTWMPMPESGADSFGDLWGRSSAMRNVFGVLERAAPTSLGVLLVGETGTGKEVAARSVHAASKRAAHPFVVVDCGAMQRNLIESELFGHERGAFTGADRARAGAFEAAARGTVFLDEIGELPLELQPQLLRVLERREVRRLGTNDFIDVDVRILAATHRDLPAMVEQGTFREDLFYRLSELVVRLPPLRERDDDIALLAEQLVAEAASRERRQLALARDAVEWLMRHPWPGNVRELRNTMRRAVALAEGRTIDAALLDRLERMTPRLSRPPANASRNVGTVDLAEHLPIREARDAWIATLERDYLARVQERFGDDVDAIAEHMGVHRKSVYRLLRQHGLME